MKKLTRETLGAAAQRAFNAKWQGPVARTSRGDWALLSPLLRSGTGARTRRWGEDDQEMSEGPPVSERKKERLGLNSARLSPTLRFESRLLAVGLEMNGCAEMEQGRLDQRSEGWKGGPIGPLIWTARSEFDG